MTITTPSEVKVLSTVVRMGMGGSRVDNASSGGIISGVDENGRLKPFAFDSNGKRYDRHPQGAKFEDTVIPNFQNCLSLCKKAAPRLARFSKLISWDLAISKDGQPILIEVNLTGGQIDLHQMANGPIFKDEETTKEMVSKYLKK